MSAAKAERRWFVTIVTPMKRGLKVVHVGFRGLHHLVTIVTPMKRGLKACSQYQLYVPFSCGYNRYPDEKGTESNLRGGE